MDFLNRDNGTGVNVVRDLIQAVGLQTRDLSGGTDAGRAIVALESANDIQRQAVDSTTQSIHVALENIRNELRIETDFTKAQKDAAGMAGIMASNFREVLGMQFRNGLPANAAMRDVITVESFGMADVLEGRSYANEAYDETDNRSAVAFSITYNLQSARQDEFGEALFPTITIPADQAGVTITANLLYVLDNVDRNVSGAAYDLKRKNVLRAVADPTVLRKEQTRALPVHRAQSQTNFVATGTLPTRQVDIDGENITTSALLFGKTIDLLGISQSDSLIAAGVQNQTDTLDPTVEIQDFFATIDTQQFMFKTQNLPYANFVPSAQGDYKLLVLNFETNSILINKDTVDITGAALAGDLAQIVTDNLIVRMRAVMTGKVRTDSGNIDVYMPTFEVYSVTRAATKEVIPLTDPTIADLITALNGNTKLGYEPIAYRSNANRRQQGQFVDVAKQYQRYLVPLRSPITARHPAHISGQVDASDVQALITTTRIRVSNEGVTAALQAADLLAAFSDARDNVGESPDVLGVGRYYVRTTFINRPFDAALKVDSIKSHERALDIQAALINDIRDVAYLLYRDSEYKAAADALYGGVGPIPTVIIATDPYLARYISVPGDLRTLGGEFNFHVVSTLDVRFRGKILITFGIFDGDRNAAINPLNSGNLLWAPELVLTANIGRGGQFSRETVVQPRYRFITNLPVMGLIQVSNIPNVLNKLPILMSDVTP